MAKRELRIATALVAAVGLVGLVVWRASLPRQLSKLELSHERIQVGMPKGEVEDILGKPTAIFSRRPRTFPDGVARVVDTWLWMDGNESLVIQAIDNSVSRVDYGSGQVSLWDKMNAGFRSGVQRFTSGVQRIGLALSSII